MTIKYTGYAAQHRSYCRALIFLSTVHMCNVH